MVGKFIQSGSATFLTESPYETIKFSGNEPIVTYKSEILQTFSADNSTESTLSFTQRLQESNLIVFFDRINGTKVTVSSDPDNIDSSEIYNTDPFLDNSLIHQYRFDDDLTDALGTSDGTGAVSYTNTLHNRGLDLDTSSLNQNDIVFDSTIADDLVNDTSFLFYLNIQSIPTGTVQFIGTSNTITNTSDDNSWYFELNEGLFGKCVFTLDSNNTWETTPFQFMLNKWYQIVISIKQGNYIQFFVYDSVTKQKLHEHTITGSDVALYQTSNHVVIGKKDTNSCHVLIDHLEIYNKTLSRSRCSTLVNRNTYYQYTVDLDSAPQYVIYDPQIELKGDLDDDQTNLSPITLPKVRERYDFPQIKQKYQEVDLGKYQSLQIISTRKSIISSIYASTYINRMLNPLDPLGDNSCIAYYPFDGDANDATGNGYDGTIVGNGILGYTESKISSQGIVVHNEYYSGHVKVPEIVDTKDSFTYTAWVDGDTGDNGTYAYVFYVSSHYYGLAVDFSNHSYHNFQISLGTQITRVLQRTQPGPTDLIFLALTWDMNINNGYPYLYCYNLTKSTYEIYDTRTCDVYNGNRDAHSTSPISKGIDVVVGKDDTYTNRRKIIIDNVRIFNRALTEEEVRFLYENKL